MSKKRGRPPTQRIANLDSEIIRAVEQDKPVTLRGVYYRVVSTGAVLKTERGYAASAARAT